MLPGFQFSADRLLDLLEREGFRPGALLHLDDVYIRSIFERLANAADGEGKNVFVQGMGEQVQVCFAEPNPQAATAVAVRTAFKLLPIARLQHRDVMGEDLDVATPNAGHSTRPAHVDRTYRQANAGSAHIRIGNSRCVSGVIDLPITLGAHYRRNSVSEGFIPAHLLQNSARVLAQNEAAGRRGLL